MKKLIIGILISFLLITNVYAFDAYKRWEITITDCTGNLVVYHNCAVTNRNVPFVISFIPNAGKMPGPRGAEIIVFITACNAVTMFEDR